jgi:hypothetical protein
MIFFLILILRHSLRLCAFARGPFFLSPRRQGLLVLVQVVHYSRDPLLHKGFTEVEQVPEPESSQPQVCKQLLLVGIINLLERLDLQDDLAFDDDSARNASSNLIPRYSMGTGI